MNGYEWYRSPHETQCNRRVPRVKQAFCLCNIRIILVFHENFEQKIEIRTTTMR